MRLKPYYTVRIKPLEKGREFRILRMKGVNPFYYVHKLHNQIYETPEEVEQKIIPMVIYFTDLYITLAGDYLKGTAKKEYTKASS